MLLFVLLFLRVNSMGVNPFLVMVCVLPLNLSKKSIIKYEFNPKLAFILFSIFLFYLFLYI